MIGELHLLNLNVVVKYHDSWVQLKALRPEFLIGSTYDEAERAAKEKGYSIHSYTVEVKPVENNMVEVNLNAKCVKYEEE